MSERRIEQLSIQGQSIGVVGLREALEEMKASSTGLSEDEIGKALLNRIEAENYIPGGARDLYAAALLREFRRSCGQPVAPENTPPGFLSVIVLGSGCAQCDRMEMDVREVLSEMGLAAALDHVTDPREIGRYGVLGIPALIVNGRVVCTGLPPNRGKIRQWLKEASELPDVSHKT
jgi:hypothetical protein